MATEIFEMSPSHEPMERPSNWLNIRAASMWPVGQCWTQDSSGSWSTTKARIILTGPRTSPHEIKTDSFQRIVSLLTKYATSCMIINLAAVTKAYKITIHTISFHTKIQFSIGDDTYAIFDERRWNLLTRNVGFRSKNVIPQLFNPYKSNRSGQVYRPKESYNIVKPFDSQFSLPRNVWMVEKYVVGHNCNWTR